jgi:hypothetical protein
VAETGNGHGGFRRRRVGRHVVEASGLGLDVSVSGRVSGIPAGRALVSAGVGAGQGLSDDVVGVAGIQFFRRRIVDAAVAVLSATPQTFFSPSPTLVQNTLECLFLASLSNPF